MHAEFGGTTPLQLSIIHNNKESFEKLSESESCLESSTNSLDQTPLHVAVLHDTTYLSLLLSKGHLVDARDKQGLTPLFYVILHNQIDSALLLIDAGANIQSMEYKNLPYNLIDFAVLNRFFELITAIFKRLSFHKKI